MSIFKQKHKHKFDIVLEKTDIKHPVEFPQKYNDCENCGIGFKYITKSCKCGEIKTFAQFYNI